MKRQAAGPRSRSSHPGQDAWLIWGPCIAVAVAGVLVAAWFIKPAPPRRVVFAAGPESGAYAAFARDYARTFEDVGIEFDVVPTAGTVANLELLLEGKVDAALVQGGVSSRLDDEQRGRLQSVLATFYEPLWLVSRAEQPIERWSDLAGRRVAIGGEGSGTAHLAGELLKLAVPDASRPVVVLQASAEALAALRAGELEALFAVVSPTAPKVLELLRDPTLHVASLDYVEAIDRRSDSLAAVRLPRGAVDLKADLPARDLDLIAATASIVVHEDTHPAVVQLLVQAAVATHAGGSLLHEPGTFPNTTMVDLPLNPEVRHYLERGPSWLQRNLPFWLASLIDRAVILAIPLMALLIPLVRSAPPLYRWRIRSRIYRWYGQIRAIDERLRHGATRQQLEDDAATLNRVDDEILEVHVPLSYMEEFYHLRLHLDLIQRRVCDAIARGS